MKDIKLIEDGAGELSKALGITDERADELQEMCCDLVNKYDNTAEIMDLAQVYANHPNEQAFINYRIGICTACPAKMFTKLLKKGDMDKDLGDLFDKLDGNED